MSIGRRRTFTYTRCALGILRSVSAWRLAAVLLALVAAGLASGAGASATPPLRVAFLDPQRPGVAWAPADGMPTAATVRSARRFARGRAGRVAFAVADDRGRLRCFACRRTYPSASLDKAMLLVADLRRLAREDRRPAAADRALLGRMIRESSNDAADAVFARNGDAGLDAVARSADMRDFAGVGYWSGARLSAADQARFFARLDGLLPGAERAFARRLLRTVVPAQTWGIPDVSRPRWVTLFKGGWRPEAGRSLVHQAARLERDGRMVTIAVLTDGNPNHFYGRRTLRGIAERLLAEG